MGFGSNRQAIDMRGWKATEERLMGPLPAKAIIAKSLRGRSEARGREGGISGNGGRVNFRRGGGRETVCLAGAEPGWLVPSSLAFHAFRAVSAAVIAQSIRMSIREQSNMTSMRGATSRTVASMSGQKQG